jgi:hypothetical protein
VDRFGPINNAQTVFASFADALLRAKHESTVYDVPKVAEIFAKNGVDSVNVWESLVLDIQFAIPDFEPPDFLRVADVFSKLPSDILGEQRNSLADELAQWALKRWEEFTPSEWDTLNNSLSADNFSCSPWSKEQFAKWQPPRNRMMHNIANNS